MRIKTKSGIDYKTQIRNLIQGIDDEQKSLTIINPESRRGREGWLDSDREREFFHITRLCVVETTRIKVIKQSIQRNKRPFNISTDSHIHGYRTNPFSGP